MSGKDFLWHVLGKSVGKKTLKSFDVKATGHTS